MPTVVLIHGGLWEEMDAERFWVVPGIVSALRRRGIEVLAPDRGHRATGWGQEVDHMAPMLPDHPVTMIAGSNGCSVAVRLASTRPGRVARMVLAWPATAADPVVDESTRRRLTRLGATAAVVDELLSGGVIRGVSDTALESLTMPVGLVPSEPENPFHQRLTIDAVKALVPHAEELPGSAEPPRPEFATQVEPFVDAVTGFLTGNVGSR
ncbi:hypothetical protein GCM10022243_54150 [Saccharothrix violaceirubra]|uniref:Pimeloyl-ACP methyl ester carboxylesterase n=1 Tax=Saccharothrix violaceirubra TaxID=413306 RepID=A0A7W7T5Y2_9PSEU|nr:alpha/beta hydrolase [Saccharothrix violaceirubra]MBB4966926.1 pimeloyl-ACP methyl ester carboxylesterase [Saccharothrix violaceirubra]